MTSSDFPQTCPKCLQRRDGPDAAFTDWEYAWEAGRKAGLAEAAALASGEPAQTQGQPGECSRCNGDRMVDGESMGDDPYFALVEQFPCPKCSQPAPGVES